MRYDNAEGDSLKNLLATLRQVFPDDRVLIDEPMANYTTFRVGGPADALVKPLTPEETIYAVRAARSHGVPCLVLGNGSNMIVRDGGLRALVVSTHAMDGVRIDGLRLTAQAGASLAKAASAAFAAELSGLEFACGIPGTVGGAVAMNAGAYGCEIAHVLEEARVLMDDTDQWLSRDEMAFGYRQSKALKKRATVLEARFLLEKASPGQIRASMDEYNACRREKQPLSLPSAGSVFKRPEGHFAGALIEKAGLKGYKIGGAQVSELHAGFIVNTGGAAARDVTDLIAHIQKEVLKQMGVPLECEVRILGEEA
jgi:UDP-N-acetylmuramate dehydrogenase